MIWVALASRQCPAAEQRAPQPRKRNYAMQKNDGPILAGWPASSQRHRRPALPKLGTRLDSPSTSPQSEVANRVTRFRRGNVDMVLTYYPGGEFDHEIVQHLHAFDGHGIVDRSPAAAHGSDAP